MNKSSSGANAPRWHLLETLCVEREHCTRSAFTRPAAVQIVMDALVFLRQRRGLRLYAWVILENHIHFIASGTGQKTAVDRFKSFTARQILDELEKRKERRLLKWFRECKHEFKGDREYQLWQEGTHPEEIQNEAMMRQKVEYIHDNPVRRGYVETQECWRYSSARDYAGQPGLIAVDTGWV